MKNEYAKIRAIFAPTIAQEARVASNLVDPFAGTGSAGHMHNRVGVQRRAIKFLVCLGRLQGQQSYWIKVARANGPEVANHKILRMK